MAKLNLVEASIGDVEDALCSGAVTTVDLVSKYLRRVAIYDCQGPTLNAIPVLNLDAFAEAAASDDRRAAGEDLGHLEGIPYTVKDSYRIQGMTVASGSPAFVDLVAKEDAFTVSAIRKEGGILIGRTNMPPMAYGGMQRGCYGRAESPYNPKYLSAAWSSGSSNGSAVSTAASMALFGMGEETVSSGRSPASNNGLVAYTPSRGAISIRGNWPLYPTCDVVVPHTRTMKDMARLLDVITANDATTSGDFWRDQPYVKLPLPWETSSVGPGNFGGILSSTSLQGLRLAVPKMYIGGPVPEGATPVFTGDGVKKLWQKARKQLEDLGAEVVEVDDLPFVTAYEHPELHKDAPRLPEDWVRIEKGHILAHAWNLFLKDCGDPKFPDLSVVDEFNIFPDSMRTDAELQFLPKGNGIVWGQLYKDVEAASIYDSSYLRTELARLEAMRKYLLDDHLAKVQCDCYVWPCQGDVAEEDSDVNVKSAEHAWKNGVHYSNGNKALRHLGIPTVTVPMGIIEGKDMPAGLTFAGRAYEDGNLLKWANAFENKTHLRTQPMHTPPLASDDVDLTKKISPTVRAKRPTLRIDHCTGDASESGEVIISIAGSVVVPPTGDGVTVPNGIPTPLVEIAIAGQDLAAGEIKIRPAINEDKNCFQFEASGKAPGHVKWDSRETTAVPTARDKTMVVVLARSSPDGFPSGYMALV